MAQLVLRSGVTFGMTPGGAVFLDTRADRYAMLPAAASADFAETLARSGVVEPGAASTQRLLGTGLFELTDALRPMRPLTHTIPMRGQSAATAAPRTTLRDVAEVWWRVRRARRTLKAARLADVLGSATDAPPRNERAVIQAQLAAAADRFIRARRLIPIAPSCLQDSLALKGWLARRDLPALLVMAVKLQPFAAHCWIEAKGEVLNEAPDRIAGFAPVGLFR